jgi:hypothetical protein
MSAIGGKADPPFALQMSANDPKQTSIGPSRVVVFVATMHCVQSRGGGSEAAETDGLREKAPIQAHRD